VALYLYAQGRCANPACRRLLVAGWHADHQQPWSRGGLTSLHNGAALCPPCNILKSYNQEGSPMTQHSTMADKRELEFPDTEPTPEVGPSQIPLRHWQRRALNSWLLRQSSDFLLVATPGAGKTLLALCLALHLLRHGRVHRIVIVCPTEHLRRQWANAVHALGLALDPRFSNSDGLEVATDYSGIVVTYHQVMFAPSLFRK
jgi:superfamily II DNA or RNA helicase